MPETRDLGSWFVHGLRYPAEAQKSRFERAVTREIEEPYRTGNSFVFRYGRSRAVVVGRWQKPKAVDEEEHLLAAVYGSIPDINLEVIRGWD